MKKELLSQLIENTFTKLAAPAPGKALYSELKNAIQQAFELGSLPENEEIVLDVYLNNILPQQHSTENGFQQSPAAG